MLINWIDYGNWKDWISPWGNIALEQRPSYCDRGRVQFKTLTYGAVNYLFNPLLSGVYFFDEQGAIAHLESVIELAQSLMDEQLRNFSLHNSYTEFKTFIGADCKCFLFGATNPKMPEINITKFDVVVNCDKEDIFVVDECDMFPRHYLSKDIAMNEVTKWMEFRKQ